MHNPASWITTGGDSPDPSLIVRMACAEIALLSAWEVTSTDRARLYSGGDCFLAWHLAMDADRLNAMLDLVPATTGGRVLDLGANPYILSYALARRGHTVVASGHPRRGTTVGSAERVEFLDGSGTRRVAFDLVRFNAEADDFPFEDACFDAAICGELIEHLALGPDKLLAESNRVLRPGGRLILSTPNATSLARILNLVRGANVDWPYSPQGIYARHNRLYTAAELDDLLTGNGFKIVVNRGVTFQHRRDWYRRGPVGGAKWAAMRGLHRLLDWQANRLRRFAEGLLVAGDKTAGPVRYKPAWLYGSTDTIPMVAGEEQT